MAELPDDLTFAGALALSDVSKLPEWLQAPALGHNMEPIARLVIERVYPHIAARVRAEAVADERRRVLRELADLAKSDGEQFIVGWLNAVEDADDLAVGAVPVATPPPEWAHVVAMPGQLTDKTLLEALGLTTVEQAEARGRLRAELDRIDRAERGAPSGPVATPPAKAMKSAARRYGDDPVATPEPKAVLGPGTIVRRVVTPTEPGGCPDGGTCHHTCQQLGGACFRVLTCEPLSGVYPGDRWPAEVRSAAELSASPVLAGHPEPWFRETPESLALLEAERAEVAAVEARAGRPAGDREAFDRRAGEEEAQAELLGHRLAVGGVTPGHPEAERHGFCSGGYVVPDGSGGSCEHGVIGPHPTTAQQPDGWGEGVEAADHPVNCGCAPCVSGRLRDSNDSLRDELGRAAEEIDRLSAGQEAEHG